MKNYTIPAILVMTVIVAGAFAFAPIDKATAVHNEIIDTLQVTIPAAIAANSAKVFESGIIADLDTNDTITLDCDADYLIQDITLDIGIFQDDADEEVDFAIGGDDIATEIGLTSDSAVGILDGNVAADVDEDAVVTFIILTDNGSEDLQNARFTVQTSGDCEITVFDP